jgi:DNA-binding phage protein
MRHLQYEDVPNYIQKMMEKEGPSALADRIGIKRQGLYHLASGRNLPSVKTLKGLGVKLMVKS